MAEIASSLGESMQREKNSFPRLLKCVTNLFSQVTTVGGTEFLCEVILEKIMASTLGGYKTWAPPQDPEELGQRAVSGFLDHPSPISLLLFCFPWAVMNKCVSGFHSDIPSFCILWDSLPFCELTGSLLARSKANAQNFGCRALADCTRIC